jgi:hypothetical protein
VLHNVVHQAPHSVGQLAGHLIRLIRSLRTCRPQIKAYAILYRRNPDMFYSEGISLVRVLISLVSRDFTRSPTQAGPTQLKHVSLCLGVGSYKWIEARFC